MMYIVGEIVNWKLCEGEFDGIYQNYKDTSPWLSSFIPAYLLYRY